MVVNGTHSVFMMSVCSSYFWTKLALVPHSLVTFFSQTTTRLLVAQCSPTPEVEDYFEPSYFLNLHVYVLIRY